LVFLGSCGGKQFVSADATGGTNAGKGGSETAGQSNGGSSSGGKGGSGTAGDVASGGSIETGGAIGAGGVVSGGCDCPAGRYCRDGSTDCFDCAQVNRLHFGTPERMATLSDNGQGSRFPRVGTTSTDLVYRFDGVGMRYTTDSSTSAGSSVKATIPQDSGPLLLGQDVSGVPSMSLISFNFLFDRAVEGPRRALFIGRWSGGLLQFEQAPAPYNTGFGDYSIAVALHPTVDGIARAYWMTTRDPSKKPMLLSALLVANAPSAVVKLALGKVDCFASDADLTPWVTADGKTLLLSHTRVDANCAPASQGKDLYTTLLDPAKGQQPADAVALPMNDVNSPMDDVDPSFSGDMCDLYFSSNREGKYALYRAHRR
jgi:hypothetical protein